MKVLAKFKVESKDSADRGRVILRPVFSTDPNHENKQFWNATPNGLIDMWIDNPVAFAQYVVGEEIYVYMSNDNPTAAI